MAETVDVAIVGGGPAGAALAIQLARRGIAATILERQAEPSWRACGVFSSPLTRTRLGELGLATDHLDRLYRPIAALNLETVSGVRCRIEYARGHALGFSRPALDAALLEAARRSGASVRTATVCRSIELARRHGEPSTLTLSAAERSQTPSPSLLRARIVVGADGAAALATAAGIAHGPNRLRKSGITFHRRDEDALPEGQPMEGTFLFGHGWYVGVAPVHDALVNVGIVAPAEWLAERPEKVAARLLGEFRSPRPSWLSAPTVDAVRVQGTLGHRVDRTAGQGWLLVGDAVGFIDPLTGEGLLRAVLTAELAAEAIARSLRGDRGALNVYDRRLRARFRGKNLVSWILQVFLSRPAAFDYALRRLARRDRLRRTLTLVLTDQLPASRAFDPGFLLRLLAP